MGGGVLVTLITLYMKQILCLVFYSIQETFLHLMSERNFLLDVLVQFLDYVDVVCKRHFCSSSGSEREICAVSIAASAMSIKQNKYVTQSGTLLTLMCCARAFFNTEKVASG